MHILIAEDDATSRNFLVQLVEKHGHVGIPVQDGQEAWEALIARNAPSLVILDRMMPGIDGAELCKKIRAYNATVLQPYIIMLTVKDKKADIVSGLEAGADDYLSKPFDSDELRARIDVGRRILDLQTALDDRIREKELLLHEVHHRMKDNMMTIGSLLNLQAATMQEPMAAAALMDAKSRLLSMGVLYDKLYRSDNVREMLVGDYLPSLVEEVVSLFVNSGSVNISASMEDFTLSAKLLSTLGIIINELATNAMKYAFPEERPGTITLAASVIDERVVIVFEDDGIGLPTSIDCQNAGGFGLKLVGILVSQLNGTLSIERTHGTRYVIGFNPVSKPAVSVYT